MKEKGDRGRNSEKESCGPNIAAWFALEAGSNEQTKKTVWVSRKEESNHKEQKDEKKYIKKKKMKRNYI